MSGEHWMTRGHSALNSWVDGTWTRMRLDKARAIRAPESRRRVRPTASFMSVPFCFFRSGPRLPDGSGGFGTQVPGISECDCKWQDACRQNTSLGVADDTG